ncbi:hypothetical protein BHE97_04190 [Aeromicrobium sp. PE09-221]|uniref:amino acid ABC transporter permease n=1 Tax=Aeromicrobium sp. PE09-221 TaxID=1898043 RepID=UPI000B3E585E|nr:amino acid ABC transporter permease [Aeromicrobium sp. PE09-221]OUZ11711.1 hypothetical protein BHE97_04190 [Aeromicrobium sp. PE09-221]
MNQLDWGRVLEAIGAGIGYTVGLTVIAFLGGMILGFPVALMRVSRIRALRWIGTAYVEICRGVPVVAWMLLIFYGLADLIGTDPLIAATVALTVVATAYIAENYRAALLHVPLGQWEAAVSLGLTRRQLFWRVIAPQGVTIALAPSATYAIGLLKESAFAAVIGVSDIAFQARTLTQSGQPGLATFAVAGAVYLLLSLPIAAAARTIDRRMRTRSAM